MKRALLLVTVLAACGDNNSGTTCGPGTKEENGQCVVDGGATCATGTIKMGDQCVPDGSVVCAQGTKFDATTGTCVLDPGACGDGTVLVGNACVPDDDTLLGMADHVEAAEPNDLPNMAGEIDTPALDAKTTLYGCVTAVEDADGDGNLDPDFDAWIIHADAPQVLEITADGIHGLSAGFVLVSVDSANSPALDTWRRFGVNLTGDTSHREVLIPAAGTYALLMTDTRPLFLGGSSAGTADTCYFTTIKHVATPTATAITVPQTIASHDGLHVQAFSYTAPAAGAIIDATLNSAAPAMLPAFIDNKGNAFHRSAVSTPGFFGNTPPFDTVGGLDTGNVVTFYVDPEYNYGLIPQDYTLDFFAIAGQALPTAGGVITAPENNGVSPVAYPDYNYSYFDVDAAGIKHFALTASKPVYMAIVRADIFDADGAFDAVAVIDFTSANGRAAFTGEFVRFLQPGRYYFVTTNPAATMAGGTYTITSTVVTQPTTAITYGTAALTQPLANNAGFHTLDLTNPQWIELAITGTANWGGNVAISAYDVTQGGWLRTGTVVNELGNVFPVFGGTQPAATPFNPTGRILVGDTRDYLLRVQPTAAAGTGPTYSLIAQDRANVHNLMTVTPGTPVVTNLTAVASGGPERFLAMSTSGNLLKALAHPANILADIRERRLNADETTNGALVDAGVLGADETLNATVGTPNWIAWTVENKTVAVTTDITVTTTAVAPRPYVITSGTIAFVDICPTGTTLGTNLDDNVIANQTLPASFAGFELFGEVVPAQHRVDPNGWLSWDTGAVDFGAYENAQIPTVGAPEGLVGPFWQDQNGVTMCRKDDGAANTVTYQWTGHLYNQATQLVQYQLVLHTNGTIDFIYGPMQVANCATTDTDGNGCTVGAENLSGSFGHQVHYNTNSVAPDTSRTLTPM